MRYLHISDLDFGPSPSLYFLFDAYIKPPCQPPPHHTHTLTRYDRLSYNAFEYLPIKIYQLKIQLKKNREQKNIYILLHVFNTMFIKKHREFLPTHQYLVGNFLVLCRESRVVRNFLTFFTLDFPLLLVALGNRLKFHINLVQGFKKLLNGFLDLSF